MKWNKRHLFWVTLLSILGIICFPANPLILTGTIETNFYPGLFALGCVVWMIGMLLVISPMVMFPRYGETRGKSFVNTTRLVNKGIYSIVRHPQYLGGILSIFVTTILWYPHWLFACLGIVGTIAIYLSTKQEEQNLIRKFGDDYSRYMQRVPGIDIFTGLIRIARKRD